jgi:hypothetical protein
MEGCTFKPKIYSTVKRDRDQPIYEKLNQKVKEKEQKLQTYKETRKWMEIKDCTFKPQILKKEQFRNKRGSISVMAQVKLDERGDIDPYQTTRDY